MSDPADLDENQGFLGNGFDIDLEEVKINGFPTLRQALPVSQPEIVLPAPPKQYCESCGHVDSHGYGCPQAAAEQMMLEDAEEEAIEASSLEPEPILPLVRRIGASVLRRFAKVIEPKK